MGLMDKAKNAAEKARGRGKSSAGAAKGDEQMKTEGERDQASGDLKQRGEHVKDAFKKD